MFTFITRLIFFTLILGAGVFAWNTFVDPALVFHRAWLLLALFFLVTAALHWGYTRAGQKGGQHFIRYFLATTTLKLFLFLMIIVVYLMTKAADSIHFAVCFLIFYIFYTVFETFHLLKHFKNK